MSRVARRAPRAQRVRTAPARPQSNEAGQQTRLLLMTAGERLFAELGVGVSTRDIGKAAGQSNKSAVAYHFGTRADLVLAITRHHDRDIVQRREAMMHAVSKHGSLIDWLGCTVRPITDHFASLGTPSWYARFLAGCINDPSLREVVVTDAITQTSMQTLLSEVNQRLPALPAAVFEARSAMTQHVIVSTCASYERALQLGAPTPFSSWADCCNVTIDALLGLWRAPVRGPSNG